jgi:hypothetical protein
MCTGFLPAALGRGDWFDAPQAYFAVRINDQTPVSRGRPKPVAINVAITTVGACHRHSAPA